MQKAGAVMRQPSRGPRPRPARSLEGGADSSARGGCGVVKGRGRADSAVLHARVCPMTVLWTEPSALTVAKASLEDHGALLEVRVAYLFR